MQLEIQCMCTWLQANVISTKSCLCPCPYLTFIFKLCQHKPDKVDVYYSYFCIYFSWNSTACQLYANLRLHCIVIVISWFYTQNIYGTFLSHPTYRASEQISCYIEPHRINIIVYRAVENCRVGTSTIASMVKLEFADEAYNSGRWSVIKFYPLVDKHQM